MIPPQSQCNAKSKGSPRRRLRSCQMRIAVRSRCDTQRLTFSSQNLLPVRKTLVVWKRSKQWVAGASVAPKVSVRAVRRETTISGVQQRAFVGEIGNIVANNKTDKTGHPFPLARGLMWSGHECRKGGLSGENLCCGYICINSISKTARGGGEYDIMKYYTILRHTRHSYLVSRPTVASLLRRTLRARSRWLRLSTRGRLLVRQRRGIHQPVS